MLLSVFLLNVFVPFADVARYGWQLGWPELQAALKTLDQERRRPNFGNAGAVNNLLSVAAGRMEARTKHLSTRDRAAAPPAPVDFMTEADAANAAAAAAGKGDGSEAIFADLIGCQAVLDKLKEWQATIKASQALGKDPLSSFELNFTFVGSPGGHDCVLRHFHTGPVLSIPCVSGHHAVLGWLFWQSCVRLDAFDQLP
jgi:hypothetical protein